MKNEALREAVEMVRTAGFKPSVVRSKHWKVSWIDQCGRTRLLVVAFSPSTRRNRVKSRGLAKATKV